MLAPKTTFAATKTCLKKYAFCSSEDQAVANASETIVDISPIGALKREPNGCCFHCLGADGV